MPTSIRTTRICALPQGRACGARAGALAVSEMPVPGLSGSRGDIKSSNQALPWPSLEQQSPIIKNRDWHCLQRPFQAAGLNVGHVPQFNPEEDKEQAPV